MGDTWNASGMALIGHYYVDYEHDLGNGMFGILYKAIDTRNGREVAAKKANSSRKQAKEMIESEIKILQHLGYHPNIVNLHDNFTNKDNIWLILEYCNLGDLEAYCQLRSEPHKRNLIATDINSIVLQAATAVEYIQRQNTIHRDIKPGNIILHQQGSGSICIKLGDYGLSQIADQDKPLDKCAWYTNAGTFGYKAPEMYAKRTKYTVAVDVFSLGLVLYALIQYFDTRDEPVKQLQPLIDGQCPGEKIAKSKNDPKLETPTDRCLLRYIEIVAGMTRYDATKRTLIQDVVKELTNFAENDEKLYTGCTDLAAMKAALTSKNQDVVNKLNEVAVILDEQSRDVRIARTSFAASGIAGGALAIGGFVGSFFTFGASLILTGVGAGISALSGAGSVATIIADKVIEDKRVKSAQETIDTYHRMLQIYFNQKSAVNEKRGLDGQNDAPTQATAKATSMSTVERGGVVIGGAVTASRAAFVSTRTTFQVLGVGARAAAIGGAAVAGIGVAVNLGELVYNSFHIHKKTPSDVANDLRDRANEYQEQTSKF